MLTLILYSQLKKFDYGQNIEFGTSTSFVELSDFSPIFQWLFDGIKAFP